MEIELTAQLRALLLSAALGVLIGLLYDLLRPPRRRTGRTAGALLDLLFCLLAGIGAFLYGMSAGNGRLGLWDLMGMLAGFLLYLHTLSPLLLPRFTAVLDFCGRFADRRKKERRKSGFSAKNTSKT